MTFTPGFELCYAVDPHGDLEPTFTDWTQEGSPIEEAGGV